MVKTLLSLGDLLVPAGHQLVPTAARLRGTGVSAVARTADAFAVVDVPPSRGLVV